MKKHPQHRYDQAFELNQRAKDFLMEVRTRTERDAQDRSEWVAKRSHFQRRRYGLEWRNPELPWPGSSSIVMPLIDSSIDKLKPHYVNLVTAANPPVTVLAADSNALKKCPSVELWFEFMLKWGSYRFVEELIHGIDDLLEMGRAVYKTVWLWRTEPAPETLTKERLPQRLRNLVVVGKSEDEATAMMARAQEFNLPDQVMTKEEFEAPEAQALIRGLLEREYQLDPDETRDAEALRQILTWLKSGAKKPLTIQKRDVTMDAPAIMAISPLDLLVPSGTDDIQDAEQITHIMRFPGRQAFLRAARDRRWNMEAVKEVLGRLDDPAGNGRRKPGRSAWERNEYEADQKERQGVEMRDTQQIEVHETCTWYSSTAMGPARKVVVLHHPQHPEIPFKFYGYQSPSGKWPYHSPTFEVAKKGWYDPRGVPEILDDLEEEITFQHRAKLNRQMLATALTFAYKPSTLNPSGIKWVPGQGIPVRNPMTDFREIQFSNLDMLFEREEQILKTWAEERVGGQDHALSNPLSSLSEPRTATEIQGIQQQSRIALSMRGLLFQRGLAGIYQEFFHLWHAYGPEQVWIQVTGGDEPLRLTKEELQGNFIFQPTGTIGEQDPQLEAQKAQMRIQMLAGIVQNGLAGDRFEIDLGEAVADYLEKDDVRLSRRILRRRTDEEVQQIQAERAQKEATMQKVMENAPSDPAELAIFMQEMGKKLPFGKAQNVKV